MVLNSDCTLESPAELYSFSNIQAPQRFLEGDKASPVVKLPGDCTVQPGLRTRNLVYSSGLQIVELNHREVKC